MKTIKKRLAFGAMFVAFLFKGFLAYGNGWPVQGESNSYTEAVREWAREKAEEKNG